MPEIAGFIHKNIVAKLAEFSPCTVSRQYDTRCLKMCQLYTFSVIRSDTQFFKRKPIFLLRLLFLIFIFLGLRLFLIHS